YSIIAWQSRASGLPQRGVELLPPRGPAGFRAGESAARLTIFQSARGQPHTGAGLFLLDRAVGARPPCPNDERSGMGPTNDEIRAALDRVIASEALRSSPQLIAFLRFVVETTLRGERHLIKAYTIAVEALGRVRISMPTPIRLCALRRGGYGARSNGITLGPGRPTRSASTFRAAVMCRSFSCVTSMLRKVPDRWLIPLVIGAIGSQSILSRASNRTLPRIQIIATGLAYCSAISESETEVTSRPASSVT